MPLIGSIGRLGTEQLRAINRLQELSGAIAQNNERLSTLKRINSAADDPSGLIQVSQLEQELTAAETASQSVSRASSLVSTADSAASQIVSQLGDARDLILEAAGGTLSSSEIAANQDQLDDILDSIDSLAGTEFNGRRLLDGSSGFRVSGVDTSAINDVDVIDKNTADDVTVDIEVTTQAQQATDSFTDGTLGEDVTLSVEGPDGTTTISLSDGDTTQDIADAFNGVSELTGIEAERINGNQVDFNTIDFGSDAVIDIEATEGTFNTTAGGRTTGVDAVATINGQQVTGDGATFDVNTRNLSATVEVDPSVSGTISTFTVSGEGLEFNIGTSPSETARLGLPALNTGNLASNDGRLSSIRSGGDNALTNDKALEALQIVDEAIAEATRAQAKIGSFQKFTLDTAESVLADTEENLSSAISQIEDADTARESALLTQNQLREQATLEALSIASTRGDNLLGLLQDVTA